MYHIVELISSVKCRFVTESSDLDHARRLAASHSKHTGLSVEIRNETGRQIQTVVTWRDDDYAY